MECKCLSRLIVNSAGYPVYEFQEGQYYYYQLEEHEEGVCFYSVSDGSSFPRYPMLPDYFKRHVSDIQQVREDKLNKILNQ